jgi:hypothetical protein
LPAQLQKDTNIDDKQEEAMQEELRIIDERARTKAKRFLTSEGELLEELHVVEEKRVFQAYGYPSLFRYCTDRLRISESYTCAYISIVRKSRQVPELQKAVTEGVLSASQAKRIVGVIEPETAEHWIDFAATKSQRDVEHAVAQTLPEPPPSSRIKRVGGEMSELKLVIPEDLRKKIERLVEVRGGTMLEALDFALKETLHRHDPIEKAKRAKLVQAPQQSLRNGKRVAIPATVKHEVALRDGGQCTFHDAQGRRCPNRKWTEIHHRIPVSRGGLHAAANLSTLCWGHHRMAHPPN